MRVFRGPLISKIFLPVKAEIGNISKMEKVKAVILLSGGLDSSIAAKIIKEQGIDLYALHFTSPFCQCDKDGNCFSRKLATEINIYFKTILKGPEYIKIVKNPRFGYGRGMNPCIDCRIFMFKKAWEFAKGIGAKFLITGEVVGQRPMSQKYNVILLIEKQAQLEGKILRPLSAKILPPTEAEIQGWVNRNELLSIQGRTRKEQLSFADKYSVKGFSCPAGGCLLTVKQFVRKLKDLFLHKKNITQKDILLLKVGRHFRYKTGKLIVGRNEMENKTLELHKHLKDYIFRARDFKGPVTILQGRKTTSAIDFAAKITGLYSDCKKNENVTILYGIKEPFKQTSILPLMQEQSAKYNISL